jgi:predicted nucleotidyltransferase
MVEAASLLRDARLRAGLTQLELARRAQTRPNVLDAYETGRRSPNLRTLQRLLSAAGFELVAHAEPVGVTQSDLARTVQERRDEIRAIVASHGGSDVRVFGSFVRGHFRAGSDLDLLVDVPDNTSLFTLARIAKEVGAIIGVPVDVVPQNALRPEYREGILAEAQPL